MPLPDMTKHRGFPGRLAGTDLQFTVRRANPRGATAITRRERHADAAFLAALVAHFGGQAFERGNLDAGRLSWLFGREVVPAEDPFDPVSYEALLRIDRRIAEIAFPEAFA